MENSGSLSSSEAKPEIRAFGDVSPPKTPHGILRRPAVSVSPFEMSVSPSDGLKITDILHDLEAWGFSAVPEKHSKAIKANYTYFARCTLTGQIKIGRTADVKTRMYRLGIDAGAPVELLATISGGEIEPVYHWWFAEHRLEGEWFAPHPDILAEIDRLNTLSMQIGGAA
jgi:hypothetical protein